jgi:hypothetical protein
MSNPNFAPPTPEQRKLQIAERRRTVAALKEDAKDFQSPNPGDYARWQSIARHYGLQMPAWYTPRNKKYMARYARRLGYTLKDCQEIFGAGWTFEDFAKLNPKQSIQYFFGALLEHKFTKPDGKP